MKTYELPLATNYVSHWGVVEAVREIIQNALDSDSPFEYEIDAPKGVLRVISRNSKLEPSSLVLGVTSKAEDSSKIGSFGEGFKIALLVLTREGKPVRVLNNDRIWTATIRRSSTFNVQVLNIDEMLQIKATEGLTFEISNLNSTELEQIIDSCLYMHKHIGAFHGTSKGRILRELPGKLYVGGLYICDTKMKFGYDIKPEFIQLERDRQTVSSYDLKILTKDMWFETGRFDEIYKLIEKGCEDLEYAKYSSDTLVKEELFKLFKENHPGEVLAESQEELKTLVKQGLTVHINAPLAYIMRDYGPYKAQVYAAPKRFSDYEWRQALMLTAKQFAVQADETSDPNKVAETILIRLQKDIVSKYRLWAASHKKRMHSKVKKSFKNLSRNFDAEE